MPYTVTVKHEHIVNDIYTKYTLEDYDDIEITSNIRPDGMHQYLISNHRSIFGVIRVFNTLNDAINHIVLIMTTISSCGTRHLQNRSSDKYTITVIGKISSERSPIVADIKYIVTNKSESLNAQLPETRNKLQASIVSSLKKQIDIVNASIDVSRTSLRCFGAPMTFGSFAPPVSFGSFVPVRPFNISDTPTATSTSSIINTVNLLGVSNEIRRLAPGLSAQNTPSTTTPITTTPSTTTPITTTPSTTTPSTTTPSTTTPSTTTPSSRLNPM